MYTVLTFCRCCAFHSGVTSTNATSFSNVVGIGEQLCDSVVVLSGRSARVSSDDTLLLLVGAMTMGWACVCAAGAGAGGGGGVWSVLLLHVTDRPMSDTMLPLTAAGGGVLLLIGCRNSAVQVPQRNERSRECHKRTTTLY